MNISLFNNVAIFGSLFLVVLCLVLVIIIRKRLIRKYNREKNMFYTIYNLFRTPISNLITLLRQLSDSDDLSDERKSLFAFLLGNANRLLRFSDIIADSRSRSNLVAESTDLVAFVSDICAGFQPVAEQHNVALSFDSKLVSYNSYVDRDKIDAALFVILSEYVSYVPNNKSVSISIDSVENDILIRLCESDTGFDFDKVSQLLKQSSLSMLPNAILPNSYSGLWFMCYIVSLHHGSVIASKFGENGIMFAIRLTPGTEFKTNILADSFEHLKPVVLPKSKNSLRVSGDGKEGGTETVLIVDSDNSILNYMSALLSPLYNVETASNGKTGLDKALATLPDLVITEINLPKLDGLSMCRNLKKNFDSCHIPVMVLSVNDSLQTRIECAESGVDRFISKPFDFRYLSMIVTKLIEQRKVLKNKYSNNISLPEGRITSIGERDLLQRVTLVINKRLSDPNLNVETLSDEIGMSRGHFQRKFKSITGQNPNEFIRITRLNTAAELLLNKDRSIKEIADITGFGSQSYFCTSFLKQFNISPKQYRLQGLSSE